jgi:hypothetical protein
MPEVPEPGRVLGSVEGRETEGRVVGVEGRVLGVEGRVAGEEGLVVGVEGRVLGRLSDEPVVGFREPLLKLERLPL